MPDEAKYAGRNSGPSCCHWRTVLHFMSDGAIGQRLAGEDVPAERLGIDRHQLAVEIASDPGVLDQDRQGAGTPHLSAGAGNAAAAHDKQRHHIARQSPPGGPCPSHHAKPDVDDSGRPVKRHEVRPRGGPPRPGRPA